MRDVQRTAGAEVRSVVVNRADPRRVGEHPAGLVQHERAGIPAGPQLEGGELVGALLPELVVQVVVVTEVLRLALGQRRDDVPRYPALGDVIELEKMRASS